MINRFFDFEVFPHWWCCVFGDLPDGYDEDNVPDESLKDNFVVVTSDDERARDRLLSMFADDCCMIGYNIKHYDLVIANAIYQGFSPEQVRIVNNLIINPGLQYASKEYMRLFTFTKKKYYPKSYQDLLDDSDGSLKEKEAILGLDIRETTVPFDKEDLTEDEIAEIIYYCRHDVYSSMIFYLKVVEMYTRNKIRLGSLYNVSEANSRNCTNAALVSRVLGCKRSSFPDADKIEIYLPEKIQKYCYDNMPTSIVDYVRTHTENLTLQLFGNSWVSFGNGGIHSIIQKNVYVEENEEYCLVNVDAGSYYPSMLIQFGCLSRALQDPEVFKNIYNERLRIKHLKNRTQRDNEDQMALKLVLNTTYGASGNKYLDIFDPYMCSRCCRLGQIFLGALACKLHKNVPNLTIIQTNTDGILAYFPRKYMYLVQEFAEEWHQTSGITMEFDCVNKIWQRDVNNYVLVEDGTKVKKRGGWLMDDWRCPGYVTISPLTAYVCAKAATNYLLYKKDVVEYIVECTELSDFVMTCKKGPTFRKVIYRYPDGREEDLFNCNRVIASKDTNLGQVYKVKKKKNSDEDSYTVMSKIPDHCKMMNAALNTYDFNEVRKELDYMYYIQRTADLLAIDWYQVKENQIIKNNNFNY